MIDLFGIIELGQKEWAEAEAVSLINLEHIYVQGKTPNQIVLSDNLGFMKSCVDQGLSGAFDLIYIDPPFFSKNNYEAEIKLKSEAGKTIPAMRQGAYEDAWHGGMSEYLSMLAPRLWGMHELLSDTGSFWIHLDWHAVHYLKVVLDEIFGAGNFVNEVIWNYKSGGAGRRRFARKHDTLLFYTKTSKYFFKPQQEKSYNRGLKPYRFRGVREYKDDMGWYTLVNMKDVWQMDMVGRTSSERTGYTTQKPEALIGRILESCTEEGGLCADFFGGSGTLAAAAEKTGRRWLLCDLGRLAVVNSQKRLAAAGSCFRVSADTNYSDLEGKFRFELSICEALASDRKQVSFVLKDYVFPAGTPPLPVDDRYMEIIEAVLKEDSLQLVDYWSVDFDYDGSDFRPRIWRAKTGDGIESEVSLILSRVGNVMVRVVDIFGNSSIRRGGGT